MMDTSSEDIKQGHIRPRLLRLLHSFGRYRLGDNDSSAPILHTLNTKNTSVSLLYSLQLCHTKNITRHQGCSMDDSGNTATSISILIVSFKFRAFFSSSLFTSEQRSDCIWLQKSRQSRSEKTRGVVEVASSLQNNRVFSVDRVKFTEHSDLQCRQCQVYRTIGSAVLAV